MTSAFKKAIAEAERDFEPFIAPFTEYERSFLRRWAKDIDTDKWAKNAKQIEDKASDVVLAAIVSLRSAKRDDKNDEDSGVAERRARRKTMLEWANTLDSLSEHYGQLSAYNGALTMRRRFGKFKHLVEQHKLEAEALRKCAPPAEQSAEVKVSQVENRMSKGKKNRPREQLLFMQRMSGAMLDLFQQKHDATVADIVNLMYPGANVTDKNIAKQRKRMPKTSSPISA